MWPAATLLSCFLVTLGCGTMYAYSAYAPQLSDRLSLSAKTVSSIGMIGNFSMSLSGPFAGHIVDSYGFWIPVVVSILATLSGYSIVYACYVHLISNVLMLSLALFLIGIGATCAFSASVKCAAVNFPQIRGTATATTMSGYGLSAFAMSLIAQLTAPRAEAGKPADGARHVIAVLAIVPVTLMILFGPVVIKSQPRSHSRTVSEEYGMDSSLDATLVDRVTERAQLEKELHGTTLLRLPTFWLYFLILGFMAGMGQAYIYTCGYMVKALIGNVKSQPVAPDIVAPLQAHQVAILSLANCLGRLINGTISDALKNNFRVSRLYALFVSAALCLAAMLTSQRIERIELLWLPTTFAGLFYGTVFGAYPGIISDAFGVKKLSSNWGLVALAPIPFSSWLAVRIGKIYDKNSDSSGFCSGPHCFQEAYSLHVVLALTIFVLIVLALRTEKSLKS